MTKIIFTLLTLLFTTSLSFAAEANPIAELEKRVMEHTLKNGLKIIVLERPKFPLVSFEMMFKVGGVDETLGKTGLAHLFEHIAFKGSEKIGTKDFEKEKPILEAIEKIAQEIAAEEIKENSADPKKLEQLKLKLAALEVEHQQWMNPEELDEIYSRHGAEGLNAFTGKDMTGFVVSLPSNKWELYFAMESDRMQNPVLREFYKERDVVMEERRMRYENSPSGLLWENLMSSAFSAHPYSFPTIGWSSDIEKLSIKDAQDFFKSHYIPNQATVVIVGDVQTKKILDSFEKYFAQIPSQKVPSQLKTEEPNQIGEKRVALEFDAEPSFLMGFHKPNPPHPDNFTLEMIEQLLSRGRTARFYKNIVEKKLALNVYASNGNPGERYPNLIVLGGSPRKPHTNEEVEKAIWKELQNLQNEKVSEKELEKIRNQIEADTIRNLSSNSGMASLLSYYATVVGDWRYLFQYLEGIERVTPEQIQEGAKKYFTRKNVTIVTLDRGAP